MKKGLNIILTLCILLSLAGCSSNENASSNNSEQGTSNSSKV